MTINLPKPLPDPRARFIDPQTGRIEPAWYDYLRSKDEALRALIAVSNDHEDRITALEP